MNNIVCERRLVQDDGAGTGVGDGVQEAAADEVGSRDGAAVGQLHAGSGDERLGQMPLCGPGAALAEEQDVVFCGFGGRRRRRCAFRVSTVSFASGSGEKEHRASPRGGSSGLGHGRKEYL